MKTKWYVDGDVGRYDTSFFYSCLKEACRDFGIPTLRKTGRAEGDSYYHKTEFFFPYDVDEEIFDERLQELLTSSEYGLEED
ncbi:MAG: hypothetical protein HYW01_12380 [Deltaproteobacteria bacterium]|nr:hypothetical protein [Deltaproteobacteria bacterium]